MASEWYYSAAGQPAQGPVSSAQLKNLAQKGQLLPQDLVWRDGASDWLPAARVKGLFTSPAPTTERGRIQRPPASIPVARLLDPSMPRTPTQPTPWNPIIVTALGVVFSPVWAGVLLAINAARLNCSKTLWIPLLIGPGSLLLDLGIGLVLDSIWLDLGLYVASLAGLAIVVVPAQWERYQALEKPSVDALHWLIPAGAGVPIAAFTFLVFVVVPLLPLEPMEVCERVMKTRNAREVEPYVTLRLLPAMRELDKLPGSNQPLDFELIQEEPAPPSIGGHLVHFRGMVIEPSGSYTVEGVFHLVDRKGAWKVDDILFVAVNGQALPRRISVAEDYRSLLTLGPKAKGSQGSAAVQSRSLSKPWYQQTWFLRIAAAVGFSVLSSAGAVFESQRKEKASSPSSSETEPRPLPQPPGTKAEPRERTRDGPGPPG